jgi:hypothetical protein
MRYSLDAAPHNVSLLSSRRIVYYPLCPLAFDNISPCSSASLISPHAGIIIVDGPFW